jgi:alkanesulfonate monooxygenase SsuD/methylene tetrahydromethanopterin reductase-like flavin-dependent oxidoreductase (luciferase family)
MHSAAPQSATRKRRPKLVGFGFWSADAALSIDTIVAAEMAGVAQIWLTQAPTAPDSLTVFAAALSRTRQIRVGTAITQTYPRHPLLLAQQALALEGLAPGRLRLGLGPASKDVIEGHYGLPMSAPLIHLREYVGLVRSLLWEGQASHQGRFYTVAASLPQAPKTPLLLSALGPAAFRLAGALSDGAISWMAPTPYLLGVALPNLQAGADEARRPRPPLIAHVPVALSDDPAAVRAAAQGALDFFRTCRPTCPCSTPPGCLTGLRRKRPRGWRPC